MNNRSHRAEIPHCLLLMLISMLMAGAVLADSVDTSDDALPPTEEEVKNIPKSDAADDNKNAEDSKPETAAKTVLRVTVYQKSEEDKPIENARVMVTYDEITEFERKTDKAGVAVLPNLPYGQADIDVTSSGMLSGREVLLLDKPETTLTFHLKLRPIAKE